MHAILSFPAALWASLVGLLLLLFSGGCRAPQNAEASLAWTKGITQIAQEVAKEGDVALSISIAYDGEGEVYLKQSAGLDTGISGSASIQANFGKTPTSETDLAGVALPSFPVQDSPSSPSSLPDSDNPDN